ncbi:MAG: hypothetical protein ABI548_09840 [Polyangiaceae bacterium]
MSSVSTGAVPRALLRFLVCAAFLASFALGVLSDARVHSAMPFGLGVLVLVGAVALFPRSEVQCST